MSRSGYVEDLDNWDLIRWRGQVASAIRGKRGQQFFRDMVAALEAMPDKRLIKLELETDSGEVCAMGALARSRGISMKDIDPDEPEDVAAALNVARQLAMETAYENDEHGWAKDANGMWGPETPEQRYERMLNWAKSNILAEQQQEGKQ